MYLEHSCRNLKLELFKSELQNILFFILGQPCQQLINFQVYGLIICLLREKKQAIDACHF